MSLQSGNRLGPYEILAPLGAGGMGEVYRARDMRLGREIALKVLPEEFSADPERLRRFEQEAKSASALNHPNIVTIFDIGREGPISYLAMELVDGASLRDVIESRPMATKKLLALAAQAAEGLSAAHERGIVHRDLKPENLMVDRAGRVKILDFGLAKLLPSPSGSGDDVTVSLAERTSEGTILGTVGYMSPEQASGKTADFRSDQFSLGAILYEMATGRRAFRGATPVETLSSVIRDEPPPIRETAPASPTPLIWILDRCLAKAPLDRYGSTRDLARDLANLRESVSEVSAGASGLPRAAKAGSAPARWKTPAAGAAAAVALAAGAFLVGARRSGRAAPTFEQLTFRRGTVVNARFAPDGDTVMYGAAWDGKPFEIFSKRGSSAESRSLGLTSADLLSISRSGEMAISVNRRVEGGFIFSGTLARAELSGGAPREVLENVADADWSPDGKELAVTHRTPGGFALDFPAGKKLFSTAGWISHARVSPGGESVAFIHHSVSGDDRGDIMVTDRAGKSRILAAGWSSAQGLAWRPDGGEVWFTASKTGVNRVINAVTLSGRLRVLDRMASSLVLQDVSRTGRVLLARTDLPVSLVMNPEGGPREINVSWLDASIVRDISGDGKMVSFTEAGQGGGPNCSVFVRRVDQPQAIRLGDGWAQGISADGRFILAIVPGKTPSLVIYPVGAGAVSSVEHAGIADEQWAAWLPDGKRVVFAAQEAGRGKRIYVQDLAGGKARSITPEGVGVREIEEADVALSPDGHWVVVGSPAGAPTLYPVEGGAPRPVTGVLADEAPVGWSDDGTALFVKRGGIPAHIFRVTLADGRRTPFRELSPSDPAGVTSVAPVVLSPNGKAYAYSCLTYLSALYVVDGLR